MLRHHMSPNRVINAGNSIFLPARRKSAGVLLAWPELDALVCVSDELTAGALRVPTTADQSSARFSGGRLAIAGSASRRVNHHGRTAP